MGVLGMRQWRVVRRPVVVVQLLRPAVRGVRDGLPVQRHCSTVTREGRGSITMVMNAMPLTKSRITAQGQISVPAEVRRKLGVGPGSVLEWEQVGEQMLVRRAGTYSSEDVHRALFAKPTAKRTLDDLKRGPAQFVRKRHARG